MFNSLKQSPDGSHYFMQENIIIQQENLYYLMIDVIKNLYYLHIFNKNYLEELTKFTDDVSTLLINLEKMVT